MFHSVLTLLPLLLGVSAEEALVMIGGEYIPGYLDNEVEVWSPTNCSLQVPSTPDYFSAGPGVILFENHIYVCGGMYIPGVARDLCDIYDLQEGTWKEGPALASQLTNIKMAAVGDTLIAIANQNNHLVVEMLNSGESSWTESFPFEDFEWIMWVEDIVVFNDEEVAISVLDTGFNKHLFFFNVPSGEVLNSIVIPNCEHSFMFEDRYTCIQENNLLAIVEMSEDYTDITWDTVGTIPSNVWLDWLDYWRQMMKVVDGLLTVVHPLEGEVYYQQDGEWKDGGALDVLRQRPSSLVVKCQGY